MSPIRWIAITLIFLALAAPALAQNEPPAGGQPVTAQAADSTTLNGMFWAEPGASPVPGVLLAGAIEWWQPLIQPLRDAGYAVLVGDFHDRSSGPDADILEADAQTWLNWLAEQPGVHPYGVAVVGAEWYGTVTLLACVDDPRCATAVVLGLGEADPFDELLASGLTRYEHNLPEVLVLINDSQAQRRAVASLVAGTYQEMTIRLYPDTAINPLFSSHRDQAIADVVGWLNQYTAESAVTLDGETAVHLALSMEPSIEMQPGESHQFVLSSFDCCYVLTPVHDIVQWSVTPSDGAAIDRQTGVLTIGADTSPGSVFTVTASVENGKYTPSVEVHVFTPESNPLVGNWHEVGQITCDNQQEVSVDSNRIGELVFNADGTFSVTWMPFEVYKDYWGTYTFDLAAHTLSLSVQSGNYEPGDVHGSGRFSIDAQGRLHLEEMWLGTPQQNPNAPLACGHIFAAAGQ
jgi:dienelactone hydrolase